MNTTELFGLTRVTARLIYLVLVISCPSAFAADSACGSDGANAQAVLTAFIEGEFDGAPDMRMACAATTKGGAHKRKVLRNLTVSIGGVISLDADPLIIVRKYAIGDVVLDGDKASATATYDVVAKTRGHGLPGRSIYTKQIQSEIVHYSLERSNGKWLLIDPVMPHVSIESMVKQYKGEIQAMTNVIADPRASNAQKKTYDALKKEFDKLQALRGGS